MIIKEQLNKPYTEEQRVDFIIEQNHRKGYLIEEREDAIVALGPDEKELRIQEIDSILRQLDLEYEDKLNTPVNYEVNSHLYKPKWAEETYISLLTAGQLMPSMFPMLIWDATELEENAVNMSINDLTQLTMYLAGIQQQYFNERKTKKAELLKEKEELENKEV